MIHVEKTADENAVQMLHIFTDYMADSEHIQGLMDKMATEYVLVDDMEQLVEGRYVRWIRDGVMTRGGIILQVGSADQVDMVLCKTSHNVLVKFRFNECPCFAKLNMFEQWYMLNNNDTDKNNDTDTDKNND